MEYFLQLATTREVCSRGKVTVALRERAVLNPVYVVSARGSDTPPYEYHEQASFLEVPNRKRTFSLWNRFWRIIWPAARLQRL